MELTILLETENCYDNFRTVIRSGLVSRKHFSQDLLVILNASESLPNIEDIFLQYNMHIMMSVAVSNSQLYNNVLPVAKGMFCV